MKRNAEIAGLAVVAVMVAAAVSFTALPDLSSPVLAMISQFALGKLAHSQVKLKGAPRAPYLPNGALPNYNEKTLLVTLAAGAEQTMPAANFWNVPDGSGDCVNSRVTLSWSVLEPFPEGRDEFELYDVIQQMYGMSQLIGQGAIGLATVSVCDELRLANRGVRPYRIEIRYASTEERLTGQ